ncbi:MAG: NAD(P)H-dependent glycerol-3-phosphate dehydrogenase [Bacillota bacterium]
MGAGSWGTALANLLACKNYNVMIWGRNKEEMNKMNSLKRNFKYLESVKLNKDLVFSSNFKKVIKNSEVVVLAVASQAMDKVLKKYSEFIDDQIIVDVSKGIDIKSLNLMSEVIKKYLPENSLAILSGPSHAEEVSKKMPTTIVSASKSREIAEKVQDIFSTEYLRVYTNPDVLGVEIGAALKNIIAIGAGISDGLGYGDNAKAALMTRGINEIANLGVNLGAKLDTFKGLSGIGDLIVTCTSNHSRNRRCGILLGKGKTLQEAIEEVGMVVEGAYTIKAAYQLAQKHDVYMPITNELYKVLYKQKSPKESVSNLMLKRKKHEFEKFVDEKDWM